MKKVWVTLCLLNVFFFTATGQGNEGSLEGGTLKSQFDYLMSSSNNYQDYKVAKIFKMNKFYGNVADSITSYNSEINELSRTVNTLEINIDTLKGEIKTLNDRLERISKEKNSMSLFGMLINKNVYNTLLWSLIIGMGTVISLLFFRFQRSHVVTKKSRQLLDKTKEEFEAYKQKTLEKEQQIMRELQDERNKNSG